MSRLPQRVPLRGRALTALLASFALVAAAATARAEDSKPAVAAPVEVPAAKPIAKPIAKKAPSKAGSATISGTAKSGTGTNSAASAPKADTPVSTPTVSLGKTAGTGKAPVAPPVAPTAAPPAEMAPEAAKAAIPPATATAKSAAKALAPALPGVAKPVAKSEVLAPPAPKSPGNTPPASPAKKSVPVPSLPAAGGVKPVSPAPNAEAEAVWRSYEKRWSETDSYSAGFRQTIEVPDIGSKVESAGQFYFAKPGLVRWEYTEGPPQTVVGDGTWIWLYQPDLQQVYKIPYAKAFGRGGLVELLAGREGVSERYSSSLDRPDATTVRIFLKSLAEGGGDLEVTLAADTFDLRAVTVHDAAGSTTRMTFTEPKRNGGIDGKRFTFTPPPGVDIIADNEAGF